MAARVLVAYATKMGSTREVAESIAGTLSAAGHAAVAASVRDVRSLEGFDAVVLGSALYAAHWRRDANRFAVRHRAALQARPLWLFSSGPLDHRLGASDMPITPNAASITADLAPRGHRTFGGRLDPGTPGLDPRVLATHPVGDFRDWAAIRDWAASIARDLDALAAAPDVVVRAEGDGPA
jgi:menaquinone-dependent protoporphyrinogen oxidase